ncbi:MAG: pyridoxine 5'-phosphate synthase [Bacteroidetes bacterium]|nr:pyridoxine 5'-phosphate synthase [Bacteroidota bacterium]MCB0801957.1 pyridoxine 5'-phosphate synthase [Flavobacteriales bacterium]NOG56345.1 pyridoxine 5'-phosphate synthase [Bacteroidota bacterium]
MSRLSVNINKIATLRNARGGNVPNLVQVAKDCERFGADGITIHPRPDERHIRYQDVFDLKKIVSTEFNIEGYPNQKFIDLVLEIKPEQVTLVPDPPGVLTSNAGWDTIKEAQFLEKVIERFKNAGIRVSIFMETDELLIRKAKELGTDRIELYTGPFAEAYSTNKKAAVLPFTIASKLAAELNLGLNAGHDLSLENLKFFKENTHQLLEVSIGHALISDALYLGLENTIQLYKRALNMNQE